MTRDLPDLVWDTRVYAKDGWLYIFRDIADAGFSSRTCQVAVKLEGGHITQWRDVAEGSTLTPNLALMEIPST